MGSCFAGHMASKFDYYQFDHLANPLGVIFHPHPLTDLLERATQYKPFTEDELFFDNRQWASYWAHSSMSRMDKETALAALNSQMAGLSNALAAATHLVLTFGSAWGYERDERIVANCHKMPAHEFKKSLTSLEELQFRLRHTIASLYRFNPQLQIIVTVSPVRHTKDGMIENMHSKARLLELANNLRDWYRNVDYFPAYEIMMDELRDYRFYKQDMIHPSEQAVDYIWERFEQAWIAPQAAQLQKRIAHIRQRQAHTPLFPDSPEHKAFLEQLTADIEGVQAQFPHINLA